MNAKVTITERIKSARAAYLAARKLTKQLRDHLHSLQLLHPSTVRTGKTGQIRSFLAAHPWSTHREIANAVGLNSTQNLIGPLVMRGTIVKTSDRPARYSLPGDAGEMQRKGGG